MMSTVVEAVKMKGSISLCYRILSMPKYRVGQTAEKWKSEDDWYGWNFYKGKAAGMNEASIIFNCVRRLLEQQLSNIGT